MTKNNPGKFDCYAKADPDEPLFILRAKDPVAPCLVMAWRYLRAGMLAEAMLALERGKSLLIHSKKPLIPLNSEKSREADECAVAMEFWRAENSGPAFPPDPSEV